MFTDILLSAALAVVTMAMAYLGVHVTIHPPSESPKKQRAYKTGFCVCGAIAVILVVWQGIRNGLSQSQQRSQIAGLQRETQGAKTEAGAARQEAHDARDDLRQESTRRQQAEHDLALIIQNSGQSTRKGVAEDIRKSPINVEMSGQILGDPKAEKERREKRKEIRDTISHFMDEGLAIKQACSSDADDKTVEGQANAWANRAVTYLNGVEHSYASRFNSAQGPTYSGGSDLVKGNIWNFVNLRMLVLSEIAQELKD